MPNFIQTCYLATDFVSKTPKLPIEKINPETGQKRYCGELTWLDGKTKDGKNKYQKLRFFTYDNKVSDLIISNPKSAFDIKGFIKTSVKKNKSGEFEAFYVEIQVVESGLHVKDKAAEHWQDA